MKTVSPYNNPFLKEGEYEILRQIQEEEKNKTQNISSSENNLPVAVKKELPVLKTPARKDTFEYSKSATQSNKFEDMKEFAKNNKVAIGVGGLVLGLGVIFGIKVFIAGSVVAATGAVVKGTGKLAPSLKKEGLERMSTKWKGIFGNTTDESIKNQFLHNFIKPMRNGKIKMVHNGFLISGPDSQGKKDFFEWCVKQLEQEGVEVYDSTVPELGHSTKKSVNKIHNFMTNEAEEEFKKTGKFHLFLARGLEEMEKMNKKALFHLKDVTDHPARNIGLFLGYECKNTSNIIKMCAPAIRPGRIDFIVSPMPLAHESLDIWKEYLQLIKVGHNPHFIQKIIDEAREIFTKKGDDVLKEMEPYLKYNAPFKIPQTEASAELWEKYVKESVRTLDEEQYMDQFCEAIEALTNDQLNGEISKEKCDRIIKAMRNAVAENHKATIDLAEEVGYRQRV